MCEVIIRILNRFRRDTHHRSLGTLSPRESAMVAHVEDMFSYPVVRMDLSHELAALRRKKSIGHVHISLGVGGEMHAESFIRRYSVGGPITEQGSQAVEYRTRLTIRGIQLFIQRIPGRSLNFTSRPINKQ